MGSAGALAGCDPEPPEAIEVRLEEAAQHVVAHAIPVAAAVAERPQADGTEPFVTGAGYRPTVSCTGPERLLVPRANPAAPGVTEAPVDDEDVAPPAPDESEEPADPASPEETEPVEDATTAPAPEEPAGPCLMPEPSVIDFGTVLLGERHRVEVRVVSCAEEATLVDVLALTPADEALDGLALDLGPAGLTGVKALAGGPLGVVVESKQDLDFGVVFEPQAPSPDGEVGLGWIEVGNVADDYRITLAVRGRAVSP